MGSQHAILFVSIIQFAACATDEPGTREQLRRAASDPRINAALGYLLEHATDAIDRPDGSREPINATPELASPNARVDVFLEGTADVGALSAIGVEPRTIAGGVMTASLPLGSVPALLALPGVTRVTAATVVELQSDLSVAETGAPTLWGGAPPSYPPNGLTGRNVIIGIVDTGVDYLHPDFRTADDRSRILHAWDQRWSGRPPAGYGYGFEYTSSELTARTAVELHDFDGHGTHVAGIAAGNGRATGNGEPAFRYVGMAPEADLIVVHAYSLETQVVDACRFVFERAGSRPAVINLSLGVPLGAHDGTYVFDRMLSALTGPGRIISTSVGNRGLELNHASTNLSAGGETDVAFNIPAYTPSPSYPESVYLEGWHGAASAFELQLVGPGGAALTPWVASGTSSGWITTVDGSVLVENAVTNNGEPATSPRFAKSIRVSVNKGAEGTPAPRSGDWTIRVRRAANATSGRSDWWMGTFRLATGAFPVKAPFFVGANADSEQTIISPATGDSIIATGAYATKYSWANAVGSISKYPGVTGYPTGRIADFSGRGLRRDGVVRPDVVAPGYGVMSSTSRDALVSGTFRALDGVHHMARGTSQAAAHTTGAIALLLQQYPNLCPDAVGNGCHPTQSVRSLLASQARNDAFTTTHPCPNAPRGTCPLPPAGETPVALPRPNAFYGHGKLSVLAATPVPSPARSVVEPVVIGTPSGTPLSSVDPNGALQAPGFLVVVMDEAGRTLSGVPVSLRFAAAPGVRLASSQPSGITVSCAARTLTMTTDAWGRAIFAPRFGGFTNSPTVEVVAGTVLLGHVKARSPDRNALNGTADLQDFSVFGAAFGSSAQEELDFDRSGGIIELGDFAIFGNEYLGASMTYCP